MVNKCNFINFKIKIAQVFDTRRKEAVKSYDCAGFQQTAVTFNDTAEQVMSGSIDNDIRVR